MKDSVLSEFFEEIKFSKPLPKICEDFDMDEFKTVAGFPDYEINPEGFVWSRKSGKFIRDKISGKTGKYPQVTLSMYGIKKTINVHKMVAEAFIPKPKHPAFTRAEWRALPLKARKIIQNEFQVDHIDGDPENYHVTNLRWATAEENRDYYHTEQKYLK